MAVPFDSLSGRKNNETERAGRQDTRHYGRIVKSNYLTQPGVTKKTVDERTICLTVSISTGCRS